MTSPPARPPGPAARRRLLRLLPMLAILAAAAAGAVLLGDRLGPEALSAHRAALIAFRDAHYAAAAAAFVLAYAAIVALSLPGATLATLTGGFLFGIFPGVLLNVAAATAGAVALFLAVRAGFGTAIAARLDAAGGRVGRLMAGLRRNEIPVLLVMRLVPVVPFVLANLIPAVLGIGLGRFAATTFVGIIPGALVYTAAGAGLGEVLARGEAPDLGLILEPQVLLPLLGLAVLAALPAALRLPGRGRG
ncbi:MAG: VTT domain-containing protein [Rhodobacteraceae bacterium]|nr:VTT domain-containing protein [Paracoccaceae bacterium]